MDAPVVVHTRHSHDRSRSLGHAQENVPVLSPVGLAAEASYRHHYGPAQQIEVGQIIDREHDLGAPARLEQCVLPQGALLVDAVLVRVEKISLWIGVDRLHHLVEGVGGQFVVMIHQRDELPLRQRQRLIGIGSNATIRGGECEADPGILAGRRPQILGVCFPIRIGERDTGFPVGIRLIFERFQRAGENFQRHLIDRQHNTDQRLVGKRIAGRPLAAQVGLPGFVRRDPQAVFRWRGRKPSHVGWWGGPAPIRSQAGCVAAGAADAQPILQLAHQRRRQRESMGGLGQRTSNFHGENLPEAAARQRPALRSTQGR